MDSDSRARSGDQSKHLSQLAWDSGRGGGEGRSTDLEFSVLKLRQNQANWIASPPREGAVTFSNMSFREISALDINCRITFMLVLFTYSV